MKKMTIALFAIMLMAGFAMADDVAVTVNVAEYATMSVNVSSLTYNFTGAPGELSGPFAVTASSNYATTIDYVFAPAAGWDTDIAVGALATDNVAAGDSGVVFDKDLTMTTSLEVAPTDGTPYTGTLTVTIN